MPLNPEQDRDATAGAEVAAEPEKPRRSLSARLLNICFAIFAFEIGVFLVIFPWMDDVWKINSFQNYFPALRNIWDDPYFRGALTGLGLLNVYVACWELLRTLRRT